MDSIKRLQEIVRAQSVYVPLKLIEISRSQVS